MYTSTAIYLTTTDFSKLDLLSESILLYLGQKHNTKIKKLMTVSAKQRMTVLVELYSSVDSLMGLGMELLVEGRKQDGTDESLACTKKVPWHRLIAIRSLERGYWIC